MKNIFINPELHFLRSGWRIVIFALIFSGCSVAFGLPAMLLIKQIPDLPIPSIPMFISYVVLTIATWLMVRFVDRRPFRSIGLHFHSSWLLQLTQGTVLGAGMMSGIFVIFYSSGMVSIEFREMELQQTIIIFLNSMFLYIVVGYGEELMFRGYILQIFAEGTNKYIATGTISLLFAVAHSNNPNVSLFGLLNIGIAGVWLSVAYFKTHSLWLPIGLHFSWNFFQGFVFSLPVSGTTSMKEQIGLATITGPEWFTGGSFGPEGGMLATIMLLCSIYFIYRSRWFSTDDASWRCDRWVEERRKSFDQQVSLPHQSIQR